MEGDIGAGVASQRIAAILQGLEESGVVLTMLNRQREPQNRRDPSKATTSVRTAGLDRCSVETNTDFTVSNNANRGVQISDDRYTSCYQVAHCKVRPTSPPVTVSEFPPQRSSPSYFDGNFEVGGSGSCDRKESYTRSIRIKRLSSPDRRSVNAIPSRDAEAFAHSLRKYPSFPALRTVSSEIVSQLQRSFRKLAVLSTNRTPSGELVERILRQTQAKFSPVQNIPKTNSTRSFHKERSKWKQSKYMQAPSKTQGALESGRTDRQRTGRREDENNSRKYIRNVDSQRFNGRKYKNRTDSLLNTTYDYLQSSQPSRSYHGRRFGKDPRVDEISRQVRIALRDIYNQQSVIFPMCSKVQRRYDEHKKHCTGKAIDARGSNHQRRLATSGLYRLLELLNGYLTPASCNISKLSNTSEEQLFYRRNKASQYFEDKAGCRCASDPNHVDSTCNCQPAYGEENYKFNIQEEIHAWLSEIPVRSNEDAEDKLKREDMVQNLVKTLERIRYDDDFEQNVVNAVTECVDKMPMWNSGSKQKKDLLKDHLVQNLLDRLIPKPVDKLLETVKNFVDTLSFKHEVDTNKVSIDLVERLKSLHVPEVNEQHDFFVFVTEIYEILERLPIKLKGDKSEILNSLAKQLANEVIDLLRDIRDSSKVDKNYSQSNTQNKSHHCSLMGPCKRPELRPFYNRKRSSQHACDPDTCEYNIKYNNKILCDCCPRGQEKVDCLCGTGINRFEYPCDCEPDEEYFNQCVDEEIDNWLNLIPVSVNENEVDAIIRKHASKHLAETLKQLPDDRNFKENARDVIERWVNNVKMWQPDTVQEKTKLKKLLTEALLERITAIHRRPDKLTVIVKKFIRSVDFGDSNIDRKELTNNLIKKLKSLTADDENFKDLLISEIIDTFKESLPEMKDSNIHTLAMKLAREIIDNQSQIDLYADENTSLKEDFTKYLSEWIDEVTELSETPPNMREAKKVIDELATKLVDLQSLGIDKTTLKKMRNEIQNSLKKLNITTKAKDNLIENVIDTITDTIYAKDKTKLETAKRREAFKELNDWLKDKEELENLSLQGQYSLLKEILDKIEKANAEGHEDHQDIILESLAQSGIYIDPDIQLDELVTKWKNFSARHQEKYLRDKIQKNLNAVIDKLNIPEDKKIYLKDKLSKYVEKNITKSSITTKKGIESINEMLLETIDEVVEELHLPKDIKDQLDDVVNKNIEQLISARNKDSVMQTLLKEINYIISKEDIPEIEKKNLKYKLKHMLNEYLGMPFSNYVKDHIFENIDQIVNETPIESTVKERLINKLIHIAQDKFHELPIQTIKDHVKDKILKDVELTIEKAPLKENLKNDLKQMLKYVLNENLKQPFSADVKEATLDQFHETINDLLIPDVTKGDLIKKVTNIVKENLDELPYQTEIDHVKEIIMNDIDELIENFLLPKDQSTHLKEALRCTLAEYLDRPYSDYVKDDLIVGVNKIIGETPIDFDKKEELTFAIIDIINKRLDNLKYQSAEEFAKESILRDVMRMINETSLSNTEKDELRHKFEDIIDDCFPFEDLDTVKNIIAEGIRKTLYESSIPKSEQHELVDKILDITNKILDESFYDDRMREHLHGLFGMIEKETPLHESHKDILKNELKVAFDKYLQDPELLNLLGNTYELDQEESHETNQNDKIIKDIMDVIDDAPIPINKKHILENKLKEMVFETNRPKDSKQIIKELYKIIEELSIPWHQKKALKSKLGAIGLTNTQTNKLRNELLKDIENSIDLEPLAEEQKSYLKTNFYDFLSSLDEPLSNKSEKKIKDGMLRIIDECTFSRDQKRNLKDRIRNILSKLSSKGHDEEDLKEKIIGLTSEVIDEAPIRHHLKKSLMSQLKKAIFESFKEPLTRDTTLRLKNDFFNIMDEVPITNYQRDSLKRRLTHMLTRQLELLPVNKDDARDLLLSDIDKILDDKSLPKAYKTDLMHKLRKLVFKNTDEPLSDDIKTKIKENIAETIDEAIIPKEKKKKLKEELDNAVKKNFTMVPGALKPADDLAATLVRNICNVIKDAPISHENKRYLKKRIEENLAKRLKAPMSNDLEETVHNEMLNIVDEVAISPAQKKILKNFLSNIVSQIIHEHQSRALKDNIKENILREVNFVIDKLNLPKEGKKQLKFRLKDLIDENFEKPLTTDNFKVIKKCIDDIIAEAPLTKEKKVETRHNLTHIIDNNIKPLISSSNSKSGTVAKPIKKPKRNILKGIDSVLDSIPITVEDKVYVKQMLESVADEILQHPEVIKDTIKIILNDTSIPTNKKAEVLDKLHNKVFNNLNIQDTLNKKGGSLINENFLEGLDPLLNELQVPSAQKFYLKNKFEDLIQGHLSKSVSNDTMKVIKDNMYNIISEMPISRYKKNLLNNKLSDLVKLNTKRESVGRPSANQQVMLSLSKKSPDNVYLSPEKKTSVIREIDSALDKLQIPSHDKEKLKPVLKNLVQETLNAPLASDTSETIKRGISEIMFDISNYPSDKKNEIKRKLFDTVDNKIKPIIESSSKTRPQEKDFVDFTPGHETYLSPISKNNAMRDIDTAFNQLQIPSEEKNDLKAKIKDVVYETLETPLSEDTSPKIKEKINEIIGDSHYISSDKKSRLKNTLNDMFENKIAPMIESDLTDLSQTPRIYDTDVQINNRYGNNPLSTVDEYKEALTQELDDILDPLQISNNEKREVKNVVANILQRPDRNVKENINTIVDDMTLPANKKTEIKNKLHNLVKIGTSTYSLPRKETCIPVKPSTGPTTHENIIKTLNSTIDHMDTSNNLKSTLKDTIQKNIGDARNSMTVDTLKTAIAKAITDAPITKEEKTHIENELISAINENINSARVTPTNEKIRVFNIKGTILKEIDNDLDSASIPKHIKTNLKDKIKNKMEKYLETPQSAKNLENFEEDIGDIIEEAPISENKKSHLRQNIHDNINRNTEYLPIRDTLTYYSPSNTTTLRYEDSTHANKTWPTYSKSQQEESLPSGVIYDADDEDTKEQMSVAMSVLKEPKDSSKKKKLKENMLRDFSGIVDVINIPRNKKTDLKIKLHGITNSNIDKLFASPTIDRSETKKAIATKIGQVIDEASMGPAVTRQMKNDLKDQLVKVANKNIDITAIDTSKNHTGQSQMLLSTIDKLPVPNHIKEELRNKIMKSPEGSESSSQESRQLSPIRASPTHGRSSLISVIPEEGPVTSTPKKDRKSWERPVASFSLIAKDDVMQSLSPEERDFWLQIEAAISKWLDDLPFQLDEEIKAELMREIANDIIDRMQYLQFNPSAKKSMQEELENLQYQVFRRLAKILTREEMQLAFRESDKLMAMLKAIKEPDEDAALEKSAELEFHQQIMDIISTTLPDLDNASTETLNSFEVIKDELADAFIKLHYTGGNEEERQKLKKKINDAINKFCYDYLKKCPTRCRGELDRDQLKRELYNALKQVHPSDDLMKSVVEHVRLKDVVYDWLKKLPLKKQIATERIKTNKNVAILAKKLLDLEQNDDLSGSEIKNRMAIQVEKFLKQLALKSGQEKNTEKFIKDLIDRVNKTKASRTFDSSTRHSITLDDFLGYSTDWPLFPPCTLNAEDLEHLERIKKRACMAPDCLATLMKKASENKCNAFVSPMAIDSGTQTEIYTENVCAPHRLSPCSSSYERISKVFPGQPMHSNQFCPIQFSASPCTQSLSHMDVQPQIIIKEYYWNSTNTSDLQKSDSRLSGVQKRTCFATRPSPRCQQKSAQTCQDKALRSISCTPSPYAPPLCTPSPCTPRFYTPRHCNTSALRQYFMPCQRINPQNSCSENNGSKRDCHYSEYSEAQFTKTARKERVIELGSLDELRKPSQKERRFEEFPSSSRSPEQTVWEETRSSPGDSDEVEISANRGQTKEKTVICKCKTKPAATSIRGHWNQETRKDRAVLASNDSTGMKRCLKCCGMHCPYPSFMYFKQ